MLTCQFIDVQPFLFRKRLLLQRLSQKPSLCHIQKNQGCVLHNNPLIFVIQKNLQFLTVFCFVIYSLSDIFHLPAAFSGNSRKKSKGAALLQHPPPVMLLSVFYLRLPQYLLRLLQSKPHKRFPCPLRSSVM